MFRSVWPSVSPALARTLGVMTVVTLHPLEVVPESELAELSAEVFGDEQPSELLAEVLAAEADAG